MDPAFESAVYLRPLYECVFDSRVPRLIIIEIYVRGACLPSSFTTGAKPENMVGTDWYSLRASSPIWVSEVSLARTRERGGRGRDSLHSRELARRLVLISIACEQALLFGSCSEAMISTEKACQSRRLQACEARALRARKTLTPRFTHFFTDFEKKTDCFAV